MMFGIDIGITVSSISCVTIDHKVFDYSVIFGNKENKDEWLRTIHMADAIVDNITLICKSHPGIYIEPQATIEEPVFPYRTRNPRSYFVMCCLYALIKNKLSVRGYATIAAHPLSVKACAKRMAFRPNKKLTDRFMKRGSLTKKGMIRAYHKVVGSDPQFHTIVGRETLADSFFIACLGLEKKRLQL